MNYLAHAYLSFEQPEIVTGNMISDFVKGKNKYSYPEGVQRGIVLHRAIDTFTDSHPAKKIANGFFKKDYRLYGAAFTDVVFDHFLAIDPNEFSAESLLQFAKHVYDILYQHSAVLPAPFLAMLPYMKSQNWLYNYRNRSGIELSFAGIARRARYINESATAFRLFETNYRELQNCYDVFFPDLKKYAFNFFENLESGTANDST